MDFVIKRRVLDGQPRYEVYMYLDGNGFFLFHEFVKDYAVRKIREAHSNAKLTYREEEKIPWRSE